MLCLALPILFSNPQMKNADIVRTTRNAPNPEQTPNYVFSLPLLGREKERDQEKAVKEIQGHVRGWCLESKAASLWYCGDLNQSKWQEQLMSRV